MSKWVFPQNAKAIYEKSTAYIIVKGEFLKGVPCGQDKGVFFHQYYQYCSEYSRQSL